MLMTLFKRNLDYRLLGLLVMLQESAEFTHERMVMSTVLSSRFETTIKGSGSLRIRSSARSILSILVLLS
jgi:hypothetical protein